MGASNHVNLIACIALSALLIEHVAGKRMTEYALDRQRRANQLYAGAAGHEATSADTSGYKFISNDTEPYLIPSMPEVHYDIGEMYGGQIPIEESDPSRLLYFVFKPAIDPSAPNDEVTIYLNGGPGCSSMDAFFQENGPFTWQPGTFLPVANPYSWANITNMLWVDQPVGTGYSTGKITATSEFDIAADFVHWFKNFEKTFGIKNYKIYVTGESYAGRYVPYISSAMLNESNKEYYDLKGALVYDPCIGDYDYTQETVVAYPFLEANNAMLGLNASFMQQLESADEKCGFAGLRDKYLQFPPPGHQPPETYQAFSKVPNECYIFDNAYEELLTINPCFNIYEINQQCPLLWDVLGFPTGVTFLPPGATIYFNRTDVKTAMNAPLDVDWSVCGEHQVFVGKGPGPQGENDEAPDPIQHVLPQVIEATNRVLVANGDLDMIIITNGTLLAIQNMTWNGELGFQEAPSTPIEVTMRDVQYAAVEGLGKPQGLMGVQHYERGLMWAESYLSGHMEPEFQGRLSLLHLQWLLGRIESL